jgi:hypothetical protein
LRKFHGSLGNLESKLDAETPVMTKKKCKTKKQRLKSKILSKGGSHVGTTIVPRQMK